MGRFFRLLLMTLVLVVVFLISALTAMRYAIHGRETAVPNFVRLTAGEAEKQAEASGLTAAIDSRFYSSEVPEGRILSQLPPAGLKVRRGWRVRLAQSLGPQRVTIPNVTGESPRAAEINLSRRGLEVGSVATISLTGVPADRVVAQSPLPGATGVTSPKVNLLQTATAESAPPAYYVMPNFVGRRFGEATAAMAEAGLHVGAATVTGAAKLRPIATDVVTQQNPSAGQKIGAGAAVSFQLQR